MPVEYYPIGVAVNPTGTKVYLANWLEDTVSEIDTTKNKVITNVTVGSKPVSIEQLIGGNIQKAKLNGSKAKASLSMHKQKNHSKKNILRK